jgi:translation initiation factor IF-1
MRRGGKKGGPRKFSKKDGSAKASKQKIEIKGTVSEVLPSSTYKVDLETGQTVTAIPSGNMRRFNIRIIEGDAVLVELTPYDLQMGRISRRLKPNEIV